MINIDKRTVTWRGQACAVHYNEYRAGGMAISLVCQDGEPMTDVTKYLDGVFLKPMEVLIKDYSENEGVRKVMEDAGIIKWTGRVERSGFVVLHICEVTPDYVEEPAAEDTGLFSGGPMRELSPDEQKALDSILPPDIDEAVCAQPPTITIKDIATYWQAVDAHWANLLVIINDQIDTDQPGMAVETVAADLELFKTKQDPRIVKYFNDAWWKAPDSYAYSKPSWGMLCDLCSEAWVFHEESNG